MLVPDGQDFLHSPKPRVEDQQLQAIRNCSCSTFAVVHNWKISSSS